MELACIQTCAKAKSSYERHSVLLIHFAAEWTPFGRTKRPCLPFLVC